MQLYLWERVKPAGERLTRIFHEFRLRRTATADMAVLLSEL